MTKELVAVVNEKDEVITTKARDKLEPKDIVRVSVLWIENDGGKVLVQQRALTKKIGPGQWGPAVAGTVESHESYLTNVIKEAEEEIGLMDVKPEDLGKQLYWEPDGRFGRMFNFFRAKTNKQLDELKIKQDEVAQLQWVSKKELLADVKKHPKKYVPSAVFWDKFYS